MFTLSPRSLDKLKGVHPDLVAVVMNAIAVTSQNFAVAQGLRTQAEEAQAVATGHSRTMHSRHLTGHAVDLVPLVEGNMSWDWRYIYPIATYMKLAARELNVAMNWGGVFDKKITDLGAPQAEMYAYTDRWYKANPGCCRGPLLDGPHFQLAWDAYPA